MLKRVVPDGEYQEITLPIMSEPGAGNRQP